MENKETTPKEDIIIKCSIDEIRKQFFQDYMIIWYDPNINSQENQAHLTHFKSFCNVETFTDWRKAKDYILQNRVFCHVISSSIDANLFVESIYRSVNTLRIYIFRCPRQHSCLIWAQAYIINQVKLHIEKSIEDILKRIKENVLTWYDENRPLKSHLPAFAPIFDDCDKSSLNHLHRYLKVIPNFQNRQQAKNDFITLAKAVYSDVKGAKQIEDFAVTYKEYKPSQIIKLYTQPLFLYKLFNNSLRIASSDSIQYCRFIIKDLEQAIKLKYQEKSKNFSGLLYRGANLSDEEWFSLTENKGREIEMHGFLSASKERSVAFKFMDSAKKVLITILVPKGPNEEEQGFAEIEEDSKFPKEKEVLFNVRSRFTVLETEDFPLRHLVLLYGARGFRKFIAEQNPSQEISIPKFKNNSCCSCQTVVNLLFMPIPDTQSQLYYCKRCLPRLNTLFLCIPLSDTPRKLYLKGLIISGKMEVPLYGYQCTECQTKNEKLYFICTNCSERKKKWCEDCFLDALSCREAGHVIVAENTPFSYWCEKMSEKELNHMNFQNNLVVNNDNNIFQQGEMFLESHEYEKAIQFYNIFIEKNSMQGDGQLTTGLRNLGLIYHDQGQYKKALECHQRSLDIIKKLFSPGNLPEIATSDSNFGRAYFRLEEFQAALHYHQKSLDLRKSMYGEEHNDVAASYEQIGEGYFGLKQDKEALDNYSFSLGIRMAIYGDSHPEVAGLYKKIGEVYQTQGDDQRNIEKVLEYIFQALDLFRTPYGKNHPSVAAAYDCMGKLYHEQGKSNRKMYQNAIYEYKKALSIRESLPEKNHAGLITSYKNLGLASFDFMDYDEAQRFYAKALDIAKEFYGENHTQSLEISEFLDQAQQRNAKVEKYRRG